MKKIMYVHRVHFRRYFSSVFKFTISRVRRLYYTSVKSVIRKQESQYNYLLEIGAHRLKRETSQNEALGGT